MTRGDDLIKEIGALLVERQITKLVNDEESGFSIDLSLRISE